MSSEEIVKKRTLANGRLTAEVPKATGGARWKAKGVTMAVESRDSQENREVAIREAVEVLSNLTPNEWADWLHIRAHERARRRADAVRALRDDWLRADVWGHGGKDHVADQ